MTKLIAFGDSIFEGWDGVKKVGDNQRIPELVGKELGWSVENWAIGGTKYDQSYTGFPGILDQHPITGYDYAIWMYGVNNFGWPDSLDKIKQCLQAGIDKAKAQNPTAKLLVILPTQDFRWGGTTLYDINSQFWSQNQLDDMIKEVAQQNGVAFLDWRDDPVITPENCAETLGDGAKGVHPTVDTMAKLASRIADKLKAMGDTSDTPTPSPSPSPTKNTPQLKLARLTQASELLNNLASNNKLAVDYINSVDSQIASIFATGTIGAQTVTPPSVETLGREVRNYIFDLFGSLELYLNNLIKVANSYGVLDLQTGQATATVLLTPPTELTLDSNFMDAINALWSTIESTLNDLQSYANEF
ncbi:SGNH/GDSL hydrolase family protein [Limosilactobacillus fermentum]|uniref:SGNH/GDSL hydrolase family protein n=1 Tax=Limosilactobacillus fermentum TaxID=1613 RepID=UPI0010759020|nr:SGNH/GDSL hydrolase family protein [Limosilactobacillus fermentum]TFZ16296.1 SGNH/GDSL hydrolase family protein [Limosilactobacillus fermentum]TFZ16753.1 SGNH/GDSL hydrolase family protein [Limosilactobacillus fermentum]